MGFLGRDDDRPPVRRFQMREQLLSFGDDYWIEDEAGRRAYRVDGKVARLRDTWELLDAGGHEVARIRERKLTLRDAVAIEWAGGSATVRRSLNPIGERYKIDLDEGDDLEARGDIVGHEYEIERDGRRVAEISKKWFRLRDTYGVEIEPGVDPALILAVAVAIESLAAPGDQDETSEV
jgi:uncharacterized protein YxjI